MTALALLLLSPTSMAYEDGKTGSSDGCDSCHGTTADTSTTVSLSAPGLVVSPGDLLTIELTVFTTDKDMVEAGLNVSVDGGTLLAGSNTQTSSGEITHNAPEPLASGAATFEFEWIAPSQEGNVRFSAAGNAVNGDRQSVGDGWNTTTLNITVEDGCSDLDGDSVSDCDGDCDDTDDEVYPGAREVCNGVDDNCDGVADNAAADAVEGYTDADGDGYGDDEQPGVGCAGYGHAEVGGDCDDGNPAVYPGAEDIPGDGIDQDCDGEDAEDEDEPDSGSSGDSGEDDSNKSSTSCSVISGVFGLGALWLGMVGILRRKEDGAQAA